MSAGRLRGVCAPSSADMSARLLGTTHPLLWETDLRSLCLGVICLATVEVLSSLGARWRVGPALGPAPVGPALGPAPVGDAEGQVAEGAGRGPAGKGLGRGLAALESSFSPSVI